ncbi:MAPEG family protein [Legionella sp. CNM-4043-24]|uniref:MAPEG family protein n=1 Tax=Legionella sp. CNM-4043-24 TaxID=3421646 RepID=UPI00403A90CC
MPVYPVTSICSSLLALAYIYLSVKVVSLRHRHRVSIGDKGHHDLNLAIRAHGNFAEYVPITLILLLCAEANSVNVILLSVLALIFMLGRLSHAYTFLADRKDFLFRVIGMMLTFTAITVLSALNLISMFW